MLFPARLPFALSLASLAAITCNQISLAEANTTVLTGSVNQSTYMPRIVTSNQMINTVPTTTAVRIPAQATRTVKYVDRQTIIHDRPVYHTVYVQDNRTFFQKHPKVKAATIGAGVGAGVGGITGLITHHGFFRGAAIGAGTGAGVGLVRSSTIMGHHPIVRNIATGGLVGLGIGGAMGHGHRALLGAGIGSAVGLGASLLNGQFR